MKLLLFSFLVIMSFAASAQKAVLKDEQVTYLGKTYKQGDIVHLGYGTGSNKDFAFINYGKSLGGSKVPLLNNHAKSSWSKSDVEIEKVYTNSGTIWLKCKPLDKGSTVGALVGSRIFINIEAAVDNKEVKGVSSRNYKEQ